MRHANRPSPAPLLLQCHSYSPPVNSILKGFSDPNGPDPRQSHVDRGREW